MNDKDRAEWVNNDEPLYRWWKSTGQSLSKFVRENRLEIDAAIAERTGRK